MGKISSTKRTPLRDKFWFFENYWKCIRNLRDEIKLEVLTAIIERSFYGFEPNLSDEAEDAFSIMRIGIDTSLKNYQNGCQPKRKKGNTDIPQNTEFDDDVACSQKRTETKSESPSEIQAQESKTDCNSPRPGNLYDSIDWNKPETIPF